MQPALHFAARPVSTLTDRLADYFRLRRGVWIDGRQLAQIAGYAAWRTRLSELRRAPYSMVIENRQFRRPGLTVSEYRWKV